MSLMTQLHDREISKEMKKLPDQRTEGDKEEYTKFFNDQALKKFGVKVLKQTLQR